MTTPFPSSMDPSEVQVLTIDASAALPFNETLMTVGTPGVTVLGADPAPASCFTSFQINSVILTLVTPEGLVTIQPGRALQFTASNCTDQCEYTVAVPVTVSDGVTVLTLKASLLVSST